MLLFELIGNFFIEAVRSIGKISYFMFLIFKYLFFPRFYINSNFNYLIKILLSSIPIVALTAIFSGMVLTLQSYTGFSRFSAETAIPKIVVLTLTRELGPVLAGLMVAGRVGASIAAEIATMRVTEQIDALKTLNTNFYNYLVTPRVIALVIIMPLLVTFADIIGVYGGYLISTLRLGFNETIYISNTINFISFEDYFSGMVKSIVFGFIIAIMSCYHGLYTGKGSFGVGSATTNAVVSSSVLILVFNYILTEVFF
ncbi:MAG: ABC transporter permease [Proteobacteria bacterium]|nr:ABC transporter permease [Pseudomonadota bacterium]